MYWKQPPIIKIYEALWTIADERIVIDKNTAKVYSSSRKKYYNVIYDPNTNSIMSNDNGYYWIWYLWYPAIAYLMKIWQLDFGNSFSNALKWIHWKDLNIKFKNDYEKTLQYVDNLLLSKNIDLEEFHSYINSVLKQIKTKKFKIPGKKLKPPKWY